VPEALFTIMFARRADAASLTERCTRSRPSGSPDVLRAIKGARPISTTHLVDDIVLGCVDRWRGGRDIARAGRRSLQPMATMCGVQIIVSVASGLDAINFAAAQIMAGHIVLPLAAASSQ